MWQGYDFNSQIIDIMDYLHQNDVKSADFITLFWLYHFKVYIYINDMTLVLHKGIAKEAYVWKIETSLGTWSLFYQNWQI